MGGRFSLAHSAGSGFTTSELPTTDHAFGVKNSAESDFSERELNLVPFSPDSWLLNPDSSDSVPALPLLDRVGNACVLWSRAGKLVGLPTMKPLPTSGSPVLILHATAGAGHTRAA